MGALEFRMAWLSLADQPGLQDMAAGDMATKHRTPKCCQPSRSAVSRVWIPPKDPPATTIRVGSTKDCFFNHKKAATTSSLARSWSFATCWKACLFLPPNSERTKIG